MQNATQQKRRESNARLVLFDGINNRDTAKSIPQMEREERANSRFEGNKKARAATAQA